ncbi:hypothetical protein CLIB1444_05S05116 [[Candida] jaroonii]|uniref:Uncharacterized protein n=1 Tax=[Candida] jaroonii TaxID=467808 RepID=A0ACA9Y8D9_9ASCO|nr:hypothetical protein CLIB1444_05S05116 [[Candida] jaroonii]
MILPIPITNKLSYSNSDNSLSSLSDNESIFSISHSFDDYDEELFMKIGKCKSDSSSNKINILSNLVIDKLNVDFLKKLSPNNDIIEITKEVESIKSEDSDESFDSYESEIELEENFDDLQHFHDIELTTFNETQPQEIIHHITKVKNRDERINCNFLKLYAQDYSSRVKGYLPQDHENFIIDKSLQKFHKKYNIYKVSNASKDKLWQNIILPPRLDEMPTDIDHKDYVFVGNDRDNIKSIVMNGNNIPWMNKKSIKPTGCDGKYLINGSNPNSGITKTQYTVKGWVNKRWLPQN